MNTHETPKPHKYTPAQEAEHRRYEEKIAYVEEHRDDFLKLIVATNEFHWGLQRVLDQVGVRAHMLGRSFDESLFWMWLGFCHPREQDWNFKSRPVNFEIIFSVLNKVFPEVEHVNTHRPNSPALIHGATSS